MTAADSAAPITVIGSDALSHVGQPNLIQALAQITPSFTAESLGGDTGALTLSAALRRPSVPTTLVLINGKRRHSPATFTCWAVSIRRGHRRPGYDSRGGNRSYRSAAGGRRGNNYGTDAIALVWSTSS